MLERGATEFPHKRVLLAVLDHCWKVLPERVVLRSLLQESHRRQRGRMRQAKQIAHPGQHKSARGILGHKPDGGLRPQETVQKCGVHFERRGELRRGFRGLEVKMVEDPELCPSRQDLAAPAAEDQVYDLLRFSGYDPSPQYSLNEYE